MKLPIEGEITSGYGVRKDPISGETKFHYGIDIGAEKGTDILSNVIGSILFAGKKGNYGNLVIVRSGDVDQYFGHLDTIAVKQGQKVKLGDLLGEVGSTGYSTGNHLHWEIKKDGKNVNPLEFNMTFFDTVSQFFNDIFTPETSQESIFDGTSGVESIKESANKIVIYVLLAIGLFIFLALAFFPSTSKTSLKGVLEK